MLQWILIEMSVGGGNCDLISVNFREFDEMKIFFGQYWKTLIEKVTNNDEKKD